MFFLELFQGLQRDLLILPHIQVPVIAKLLELFLLDLLDIIEFLDMRHPEKIPLPNPLLLLNLLYLNLTLLGLLIVPLLLTLLPILIQKLQKSNQPAIRFELSLREDFILVGVFDVELDFGDDGEELVEGDEGLFCHHGVADDVVDYGKG